VSPKLPVHGPANSCGSNIKPACYLVLHCTTRIHIFHSGYVALYQLRAWVFTAVLVVRSALTNLVSHIVLWCSHKQVAWIYAAGVITMMANKHTFGDFAKM